MCHVAFIFRARSALRWLGFVVCGLVFSSSAFAAEPVCYQYRYSFPSPGGAWFDSKSDAAISLVAKLNDPAVNVSIDDCRRGDVEGGGGTITYTGAEISGTAPGELTGVVHCTIAGVTGTFGYLNGTHDAPYSSFQWRVNPDECPEEHCERSTPESFTTQYNASNDYCHAIDHCKVEKGPWVQVGDALLIKWTITTQDCGDTPADSGAPDAEDQQDETCGSSGANEFCMRKDGENCGYLNDQFICLPKTNQDGCKVFGDSSRVCGPEASIPPAPDSGTPGDPAIPDGTIQSTVGGITTVYNYYNATTITNSSRDPGTSGDNPYDGDDDGDGGDGGSGECTGDDCSEGTVSGGDTCESMPVCDGDVMSCAIIEQEWRTRCPDELTEDEIDDMFAGGSDVDGDGTVEGKYEGLPGSGVEPTDISTAFDGSGWLGSRSCPANYSVSFGGLYASDISIPLGDACWFFQAIGLIVLTLAYYTAARIVFGAF